MENIEEIFDSFGNPHILIRKNEFEFFSMPKEHWDKLEAEREQSGTL